VKWKRKTKIRKRKKYMIWKEMVMLDHHLPSLRSITWNKSKATSTPIIVAPYPTSTRQIRSSVVHATKMSREVRNLQSNHVAYITHLIPETEDQVYKREAFNSVSGFDDGSDAPKNYKEVLKHKNQAGWWASMKK
jgi:hypothetical protein